MTKRINQLNCLWLSPNLPNGDNDNSFGSPADVPGDLEVTVLDAHAHGAAPWVCCILDP